MTMAATKNQRRRSYARKLSIAQKAAKRERTGPEDVVEVPKKGAKDDIDLLIKELTG